MRGRTDLAFGGWDRLTVVGLLRIERIYKNIKGFKVNAVIMPWTFLIG